MVLTKLEMPIDVFNITEWGVDLNRYVSNLRRHYDCYTWDEYLFRQNQIEFLKKNLPEKEAGAVGEHFWVDFYAGRTRQEDLYHLTRLLSPSQNKEFERIKKTRKRLIAEFNLAYQKGWLIQRVNARAFGQEDALTSNSATPDYRLSKRTFDEMPESLNCRDLRYILLGLADRLREKNRAITFLNIIVHPTLVYCYPGQTATNSPEGVHQDGMDYIVSALVIERHNIVGGKSIVYGRDINTRILETVLQSGQGILQPDKDTELWHEVTSIRCMDTSSHGYRSTVGFDITVNESARRPQSHKKIN